MMTVTRPGGNSAILQLVKLKTITFFVRICGDENLRGHGTVHINKILSLNNNNENRGNKINSFQQFFSVSLTIYFKFFFNRSKI